MCPRQYISKVAAAGSLALALACGGPARAEQPCPEGVQQAAAAVAALHGLARLPVRCVSVSEQELRRRLLLQMTSSLPVDLHTQLTVAFRLGLMEEPPGPEVEKALLDFLASQVLGFYDPSSDTVVLAEGQGGWGLPGMETMVWAHEVEHVYQEHRFGLGHRLLSLRDASDAQLAASAVAEGDAVLVMAAVAAASEHPSPAELADAAGEILQVLGTARQGLAPEGIPRVFVDQVIFPYEAGTRYLAAALRAGGWEAVARHLASPPESTEQLLHPDRAGDHPHRFSASDLPRAPGWETVLADVTGEWGFSEWLGCALPGEQARRAAAGWDGDRLRVSRRRGNPGIWRIDLVSAWDSPRDAGEAEEALRAALPRLLRLGGGPPRITVLRRGLRVDVTATGRSEPGGAGPSAPTRGGGGSHAPGPGDGLSSAGEAPGPPGAGRKP